MVTCTTRRLGRRSRRSFRRGGITISFKFITAAALAAATLVGPAAISAEADTQKCVTRAEYKRIERGFSIARVHHVFDTKGKFAYGTSGYGFTREYNPCKSRFGYVTVDYKRKDGTARVTGKSAYF